MMAVMSAANINMINPARMERDGAGSSRLAGGGCADWFMNLRLRLGKIPTL
jgi:hypothetical protein